MLPGRQIRNRAIGNDRLQSSREQLAIAELCIKSSHELVLRTGRSMDFRGGGQHVQQAVTNFDIGRTRSATGCPEILDSWKEIAVFLKRGVRTVQRWEREEGLPVHRHQHNRGGTIFALSSEIQEWLEARDARVASQESRLPQLPLIWARAPFTTQELADRCEAARLRAEKARGHFQAISDEPQVLGWGRHYFRRAS